ncbi:MAG: MFS transporter [Alphaproteobacteria bacterium]
MISKKSLNYSILALPLSFVGLPIYINVTDFYIRYFQVNIAILAGIILLVRLVDTFQEPALGLFSDYLQRKKISHQKIIFVSSFFLAFSFFALFNPPEFLSKTLILLWITAFMLLTYSFYNLLLVNYESLAIVIAKNSQERVAINSAKEFCGLIGILLASALPQILKLFIQNEKLSYFSLTLIFAFLLFFTIFFFFRKVKINQEVKAQKFVIKKILQQIFRTENFPTLMIIFFINALAVSMPASVISFYVNDVLKQSEKIGIFLTIYFLSAGFFMIFWKNLANKIGKIKCWLISICGSILTFIFAYFVQAENYYWFYAICGFSGIFLGADLIMPPALLSELIHRQHDKISSFVAFWGMINKAGLMLASFLSLMALSLVGFEAKNANGESLFIIPILYAIIPCILKFIVVIFLIFNKKLKKL